MDEVFGRYLKTLARTERLPCPELARYRQGMLGQLVRHAHASIPIYRARLACPFTAAGSIDLSRWTIIKLTKAAGNCCVASAVAASCPSGSSVHRSQIASSTHI